MSLESFIMINTPAMNDSNHDLIPGESNSESPKTISDLVAILSEHSPYADSQEFNRSSDLYFAQMRAAKLINAIVNTPNPQFAIADLTRIEQTEGISLNIVDKRAVGKSALINRYKSYAFRDIYPEIYLPEAISTYSSFLEANDLSHLQIADIFEFCRELNLFGPYQDPLRWRNVQVDGPFIERRLNRIFMSVNLASNLLQNFQRKLEPDHLLSMGLSFYYGDERPFLNSMIKHDLGIIWHEIFKEDITRLEWSRFAYEYIHHGPKNRDIAFSLRTGSFNYGYIPRIAEIEDLINKTIINAYTLDMNVLYKIVESIRHAYTAILEENDLADEN